MTDSTLGREGKDLVTSNSCETSLGVRDRRKVYGVKRERDFNKDPVSSRSVV